MPRKPTSTHILYLHDVITRRGKSKNGFPFRTRQPLKSPFMHLLIPKPPSSPSRLLLPRPHQPRLIHPLTRRRERPPTHHHQKTPNITHNPHQHLPHSASAARAPPTPPRSWTGHTSASPGKRTGKPKSPHWAHRGWRSRSFLPRAERGGGGRWRGFGWRL